LLTLMAIYSNWGWIRENRVKLGPKHRVTLRTTLNSVWGVVGCFYRYCSAQLLLDSSHTLHKCIIWSLPTWAYNAYGTRVHVPIAKYSLEEQYGVYACKPLSLVPKVSCTFYQRVNSLGTCNCSILGHRVPS
jgi:hypothetical protein